MSALGIVPQKMPSCRGESPGKFRHVAADGSRARARYFLLTPEVGPPLDGTGAELYPGALVLFPTGAAGATADAADVAGAATGAIVAAGAEAGGAITLGATDGAGIAAGRSRLYAARSGTIISATMLMILISGFTAGPAVSLYGSPTVSPVTAALCASEPLPP